MANEDKKIEVSRKDDSGEKMVHGIRIGKCGIIPAVSTTKCQDVTFKQGTSVCRGCYYK